MAEIDRNLDLENLLAVSNSSDALSRPISSQSALFRGIRYNFEPEGPNPTAVVRYNSITVWAIWGVLLLIFISKIIYGDRT